MQFTHCIIFVCIFFSMFFQYVENHILVLTPDFILQLLEGLLEDLNSIIKLGSFRYHFDIFIVYCCRC